MAMTKKDYEKIADTIVNEFNRLSTVETVQGYYQSTLNSLVYALMDTLQSDNDRFDRSRFVKYINNLLAVYQVGSRVDNGKIVSL